jgi:hypothetical protein
MGRPSEQYDISGALDRATVERQSFAVLDAFELIWAFYSSQISGTCRNRTVRLQTIISWHKTQIRNFQKSYCESYGESYVKFSVTWFSS